MLKQIRYCQVCNVSSEVKQVCNNKASGMCLCEKHRDQYKRFGKFLDSSPRGVFDPNEIRKYSDYAEIDTYDQYGNVVSTFIIDLEDVDKLSGHKWRTVFKNDKPYLFTGNQKSERIYFHRLIFQTAKQVDHISGNTLDNRKSNLREVTIQENMLNLQKKSNNTSGVRGVSYDKRKQVWTIDFTFKKQRMYFKNMKTFEEAVYLRYLCEKHFLAEYRNTANDEFVLEKINILSSSTKKEIEEYFNNKINTSKEGV